MFRPIAIRNRLTTPYGRKVFGNLKQCSSHTDKQYTVYAISGISTYSQRPFVLPLGQGRIHQFAKLLAIFLLFAQSVCRGRVTLGRRYFCHPFVTMHCQKLQILMTSMEFDTCNTCQYRMFLELFLLHNSCSCSKC